MLKLKKWLLTLLAMAVIAVPVMAGTNDANAANGNAASATSAEASPAAPSAILTSTTVDANVSTSSPDPDPAPQAGAKPMGAPPPVPPVAVVPAIAPLRVIVQDPPKKDGLVPAFKMGPVKMTPYGFIKSTAVHDSSNPNGDDFPFVGLFLNNLSGNYVTNTGPTKDPAFHVKARATRIGANFEWPDPSPKLTMTGRIEADFEGNYSIVDNRDVSSLRSNAFQLRLAYMRLDYAASDNTDIFFEGGQDWTLFGSTALPNILETTFLGAFYGDVYERSPQFMFGFVQKMGGSLKLLPTFAIMMPTSSQIEKLGSLGPAAQLAQAEREGADSDRPEYEGRLALQFQLDKAPGVAPAQIFWSGFRARRTSIVSNGAMATGPAAYAAAFPNGFESSSKMWGNQFAVQIPTRWFTLVASGYKGGDLRFFFGGQVNTYFTDTGGMGAGSVTVYPTIDGGPLAAAGGAAIGCFGGTLVDGACTGTIEIAPQKPIRSFGGFVNLGLPLSRWFNANPKGHNAGWQLFLHAGKDQVVDRDLNNPVGSNGKFNQANILAPLPLSMGKMFAGTLYYKVNPWCTFAIEQSVYATRLLDHANGYTIAGQPSNEWQDHRTEFGPVFTF